MTSKNNSFSATSFALLFIATLKREGVPSFNYELIGRELLPYYHDEKFQKLFENVELTDEFDTHAVYIQDELSTLQQCNCTCHLAAPHPNHNIWRVRLSLKECNEIYERYDPEYQQLMTELVQQYKKERLAEKISRSIKIYVRSNDPNGEYRLIKGKGHKGFIGERILMEQQLITDGTVTEMESKDSYGEDYIYGYDAFKYEEGTVGLSLVDAIAKKVLVSDATFTIIKYFEENKLIGTHIHTKEQDLERLIALAKLSKEKNVKEKAKIYTLQNNIY